MALAALLFHTHAFASEVSPAKSIGGFFDLLLKGQVQKAADSALFSDREGKERFIKQWSDKAKSLSGYGIEEWTIEPREGRADVSLEFRDPSREQTLKISLVKLNGIWRVSPEGDFKLYSTASSTLPQIENLENLVHVTGSRKGNRVEFSVVNKAPFSVLFRLEMSLPPSLRAEHPFPLRGVLPPTKSPIALCNLQVIGRSPGNYSWRYTVKRADDRGEMVQAGALTPLPKVSLAENPKFFVGEKYAYGLPYPAGISYMIWQGPGGSFSHNEPGSRYAVDFSMPVGSEIAAARAGVVIAVIQKNPNNPDEKTAPAMMANEVLILHADGTTGVYAHLTTDGAKVSFGETVRRGQVIGLSGNSGYSRGPHLHFDILGYKDGQSLSRPFGFLSADGAVITPRKGLILLAEKNGLARIARRETSPRRVVRKCYKEFDTEIRHFAKTADFLAINKTGDPIGIELSFSSLQNAISRVKLPRRIALPADGTFHHILSLEITNPGEGSAFAYVFRRVEAPGREHIPLRVEQDDGNDYTIEIRYFSDKIELYAENKRSWEMVGMLDFPSLDNVIPKEKAPRKIRLPADASAHYLATLMIVLPTKGYSFAYHIGSPEGE